MGIKKLAALVMALMLCLTAVSAMAAVTVNGASDLLKAITDGKTDIVLGSDINFSSGGEDINYFSKTKPVAFLIDDGKNYTIDLGTHTITLNNNGQNEAVFGITNGSTLTLKNGNITTNTQYIGVVTDKSTLNIEENATLKGTYWKAGATPEDDEGCFGVFVLDGSEVNVAGTVDSTIYAISGNGNKDWGNTTISVTDNAEVKAKKLAIFHPQLGTLNVSGGKVSGDTGIEMRSGTLNVTGGIIEATGAYSEKASGNGFTITGAAIAVSQHTTNNAINVNVNGGTIIAEKGKALAENDLQDSSSGNVKMSVNGATIDGQVSSQNVKDFIKAGIFSEKPNDEYVASGKTEAMVFNGKDPDYVIGNEKSAGELIESLIKAGTEVVINKGSVVLTNIPADTTVVNKTTGTVTVNGVQVSADEVYVVPTPYSGSVDLPQTGDNSSLMLWSAMLALAAAGFVVTRKTRLN